MSINRAGGFFVSSVANKSAFQVGNRKMATLKDIKQRMKTVGNIQKITKSMKMVSAAKYNRCERELRSARTLTAASQGLASNIVYDDLKDQSTSATPAANLKRLVIGITSDRGLCGGIHSSVIRYIKNDYKKATNKEDLKVVLLGDKLKAGLTSTLGHNILLTVNEISKTNIEFDDALFISSEIFNLPYKFDKVDVIYNRFLSPIQFETTSVPFYNSHLIRQQVGMGRFDDLLDESVDSICQYQLASMLFYILKESAASEQSARMAAMDNASRNATDMITRLSLLYNRTRQGMITRELIEIISGAASVNDSK